MAAHSNSKGPRRDAFQSRPKLLEEVTYTNTMQAQAGLFSKLYFIKDWPLSLLRSFHTVDSRVAVRVMAPDIM